jgi:cholesterol transport system auxiliary component
MLNIPILILIISGMLLSGCSSFLAPVKSEPQNQYVLNRVPPVAKQPTTDPKTILVAHTQADSIYNSTQMSYTLQAYQIAYFANNRWAETPTRMLQALIVQTLQATQHFRAVVSPPFIGRPDYVLNTQLLELQQDFLQNPSVIHIKLRVQLIKVASNQVIVDKELFVTEATEKNTPYGGVIAANHAAEKLMAQLARLCMVQ